MARRAPINPAASSPTIKLLFRSYWVFNSSMYTEGAWNMSDYAYILNWIGSVYQKQGWSQTRPTALRRSPDTIIWACATAPLSISNVPPAVEEALRRAKTRWHIRNELFKQERWARCTSSALYRVNRRTAYHQTAGFQSNDSFQGRIRDILRVLGIRRASQPYITDWESSQWTREHYLGAITWPKKDNTPMSSILMQSHNPIVWISYGIFRKGKSSMRKRLIFLQQGSIHAKEVYDDYQQAESLVDLVKHSSALVRTASTLLCHPMFQRPRPAITIIHSPSPVHPREIFSMRPISGQRGIC